MKKSVFLILLFLSADIYSQENISSDNEVSTSTIFQAEYFYGNIVAHQPIVTHILQGHPEGVILSWSRKNYGKEAWEQHYNYPDVGLSFAYQDYKSDIVGDLYSIYGHYDIYLFNRTSKNHLILRAGIGLAYNTNPYDKVENNKNISFGTYLNSSTYFKLYYQREHLFNNFGIQAGLTFIHASNSNVKSPNTGLNTWGATIGLNYNIDEENTYDFIEREISEKFKEPIKFNLAFRAGINESEIIGSGSHPFYVFSGYADKRLNRKSAIQFGTDVFISPFLTDFINYYNINFPNDAVETSDISRVSLFLGHELFINKLSIIAQLGYYVHYPFPYETQYYERLGLKRYFKDKWFAVVSLKAHAANAETVEFGFGMRF